MDRLLTSGESSRKPFEHHKPCFQQRGVPAARRGGSGPLWGLTGGRGAWRPHHRSPRGRTGAGRGPPSGPREGSCEGAAGASLIGWNILKRRVQCRPVIKANKNLKPNTISEDLFL